MSPNRSQWCGLARVYARNVRGLVAPHKGAGRRFSTSAGLHLMRHGWLAWHHQRQGWVLTPAGLRALDVGDRAFGAALRERSVELADLVGAVDRGL